MAQLSISLFGPFQVSLAGRPVTDFGTDKTRALLAYLAVEADHPQRRDALAGLLWADHPQARARQSLRQALSQLRQAIADQDQAVPFLLISRETIQFNPASDHRLDVAEFSALAEANRTHRHRRPASCAPCMRRLAAMAGLYGGSFLAGFFLADSYAFEEWASLQREHSQRQMMDALAHLVQYHERRGDVRQALQVAGRQVQIEPWCEEAHRQLMRLLALDGQRSAALAQYNACRQSLAEELDVEPTAETTALYEQIRDHDGRSGERSPPGVASRRHNRSADLAPKPPPSPTPFVGRQEELAELLELLADPDCRLVTLTGPGGIGKTRLALEVAASQLGVLAHGVTFVPLAALASADLLVPALAEALGFRLHSQGDPEQQLSDLLREKEMLLVLDNMEHLIEGGELVSRILRHAPEITLLVTSRERLHLHEEWVYSLDGLAHPTDPASNEVEAFDAVALFVQTVRRGHRRFVLTEQQKPHVVHICRLVEGLPLAVELAASWVPSRTCQEVARQIERNLGALATPLRNVPERHRSLRAAFEHSWELLAARQRAALCKLSIFRGGFERHAAHHVADAAAAVLDSLVDKSLLRRAASGRYDLHRLIQQYAAEKLQEAGQERPEVEKRHGDYYSRFLQERAAWFQGQRQAEALAAVAAEIDNVRLAWRLATARGDVEALGRSLPSLGAFYTIRSWHQEAATAFGQAVAGLSAAPSGRPTAGQREIVLGALLAWQGHFLYQLGRYDEAQGLLEKSLGLLPPFGTTSETAFSLYTLAQILCFGKNDYAQAKQLFQDSLTCYQALDDRYGTAQVLDGLGDVAVRQGNHSEARQHYEKGLALRRQIGDVWGISASLGSLGGLAGRQGRYDEARRWFEESLAIGRELQNPRGVAASLHNLSTVVYLQQEYAEAKRLRLETLAICREIGYRWGIASALKSLGDVAGRLGEYGQARQFLRQSLALLEEAGDRRSLAYALNSLGAIEQALGQQQAAQTYFRQALQAAMAIQEPALALDVLTGIAQLCGEAGEVEQALELVAFIFHHPASEQQTRAQVEPLQAGFAARLSAEAAAMAEARGRLLELDGIAACILKGSSYRSRTT